MDNLIRNMGASLYHKGDYQSAMGIFQRLAVHQRSHGNTESLLESETTIARCLYRCDRIDEALTGFNKVLIDLRKFFPEDHDKVLEVKNEIALCFLEKGNYVDALDNFKAIATVDKAKGNDNEDTLVTQGNIGLCLSKMNRLQEAHKLIEQTLREQIEMHGETHPHVFATKNNLAGCLERMGGTASVQSGLKILETTENESAKSMGSEHLSTLQTKQNQIACLMELGKHDEAFKICIEVKQAIEKQFGRKHKTYLHAHINMVGIMSATKKYDEAIILALECKKLHEDAIGPNHPDIINVLNTLACCYLDKGNYKEALKIQQSAMKRFSDSDHVRALVTLKNNMALCLDNLNQREEALHVLESVEHELGAHLGKEHDDVITVMKNRAQMMLKGELFSDAAKVFREVEILRKKLEQGEDLLEARKNLLNCYLKVDDLNQAREVYSNIAGRGKTDNELTKLKNDLALRLADENYNTSALRVFKEVEQIMEDVVKLAPSNCALINTKENIGSVYEQMGRIEEAKTLYEYVNKMRTNAVQ